MNNYYKNNLIETYKRTVFFSVLLILLSSIVTLYILYYSYKKYNQKLQDTYVFSSSGASIHVYLPNQTKQKNERHIKIR